MSSSSSVLHRLQSQTPRSKNRKQRKKEAALSKYAPLVKYVVDRLALHLPKSVTGDEDQDFIQLEDIVDDPAHKDALEIMETEESREVLLETIDHLPEQQRLVVALYYYEEMTLKEIGEALHISESRVSQIP